MRLVIWDAIALIMTSVSMRPKTPVSDRFCISCKIVEDETHFLISCPIYHEERHTLITQVSYPQFLDMDEQHAFLFLITNEEPNISTWAGKFMYSAFVKRRSLNIDMTESIDGTPPNVARDEACISYCVRHVKRLRRAYAYFYVTHIYIYIYLYLHMFV